MSAHVEYLEAAHVTAELVTPLPVVLEPELPACGYCGEDLCDLDTAYEAAQDAHQEYVAAMDGNDGITDELPGGHVALTLAADDVVAITGTPEQIRAMLHRALAALGTDS